MRLLEGNPLLLLLGRHGSIDSTGLSLRHNLLLLLRWRLLLLYPLLLVLRLLLGLSGYSRLLNLLLLCRLLLLMHPFRLHPNIHRQLLQSLLQGGNIIVCVK